ncbi:hypothetical protein [Actinoplanes sp. NPDC051859]|uniref:hypothetical protein n=1 Tax=Actinoplanes sp. NPDC051859 TaxID=3363909 RepID=UPI00378EA070
MRLKARVATEASASNRQPAADHAEGSASMAALYPRDYWVSVPDGVPLPSEAPVVGVNTWRLVGNTFLFGDINGSLQQYVQWGKALLVMQSDGNPVLYDENGRARWASNTNGNWGAYAYFQPDGNLVVYSASGRALRASNTCCHSGWNLHVQSDGNMVIYAPVWAPRWATNTAH